MRKWLGVTQVSFTYMGTVVGAGFATGQEILQFFTKYGWMATFTIGLACFLFVLLGMKLMLLSYDTGARSYEDLNKVLFGERVGQWVSLFMLVVLFGVTTVMLAGAGSVFHEQLHVPLQVGLLLTLGFAYIVLARGMKAIMAVNSIVVPMMLLFSVIIVWDSWNSPGSENWIHLSTDQPAGKVWMAPLQYAAFNLAMAQAVLVPLGSEIKDRSVLRLGGLWGGAGIGLMLLAGHFGLSAQMPDVAKFDIPMGSLVSQLGTTLQVLFLIVIYGEIFTTYIADAYGLSLQLSERFPNFRPLIVPAILLASYAVSQFGFRELLSFLYPLFGMFSMAWLVMLAWRKHPAGAGH